MRAVVDRDAGWLERWRDWIGGETAIVWDTHLGGAAVTVIGIESRPLVRTGYVPSDGPETWTAGTLFPQSSKKVAQALNRASGIRPAVILANLSGFDGSPESMRCGILEFGAEIARAEWYLEGQLPLHTLRADVDYGFTEARTTYGVIGIKVWIYRGESRDIRVPEGAAR